MLTRGGNDIFEITDEPVVEDGQPAIEPATREHQASGAGTAPGRRAVTRIIAAGLLATSTVVLFVAFSGGDGRQSERTSPNDRAEAQDGARVTSRARLSRRPLDTATRRQARQGPARHNRSVAADRAPAPRAPATAELPAVVSTPTLAVRLAQPPAMSGRLPAPPAPYEEFGFER